MEPIATYSESRFDGKRSFELFADKVIVRGKENLQSNYVSEVALSTLTPNLDRMRHRSDWFMTGLG